jgi:hypothetical protein
MVERSFRHADNQMLRMDLFLGAGFLTIMFSVAAVVTAQRSWNRWNEPEREVDSHAGEVLAQLRAEGGLFTAVAEKTTFLPSSSKTVIVDATRETVEFRGFTFVTRFRGNKSQPSVVVPFAEILGGRAWTNHGQLTVSLRTTIGNVGVAGLESMPRLGALLFDIAESNRRNPEKYAAALAREPRVRTPWWAWLIPAAAIAVIALIAWLAFR